MAGPTKKTQDKPAEKPAAGRGTPGRPPTKDAPMQSAAGVADDDELDEDEDELSDADVGTADPDYDLVSVLYHALQGAETYAEFVDDAEDAGDRELAQFFLEVQREEEVRAERAKVLLAARLGRSLGRGYAAQEGASSSHPS